MYHYSEFLKKYNCVEKFANYALKSKHPEVDSGGLYLRLLKGGVFSCRPTAEHTHPPGEA